MTAIISSQFRLKNATTFKNLVGTDSIYVLLGKSDAWSSSISVNTDSTAPTPIDQQYDGQYLWQNAMALKRVQSSDATNLVPRHDWQSGQAYVGWDDQDPDIFTKAFYILTSDFKVYKCIQAGAGPSTIMPTQENVNPTTEGDGYTWKYMYTLSSIESSTFLTNSYVPAKLVSIPSGGSITDLSSDDQAKYTIQQNSLANAGKIYRIILTNGGTGYTSTPTVTVYGDGSGCTATATINGSGNVTGITVTANGANYNVAYITISGGGGTGATARPVLSPPNGHGTDPVSELGGFFLMLRTMLTGAEGGDFVVHSSFRQIGVVINPFNFGTSTTSTATTLSALPTITFGANSGFTVGDHITGTTSGAQAFIDDYDSVAGTIKYHQNDKTGYRAFQAAETVTGSTGGTGTISSLSNPEVQKFSGKVVFIENRAPVNRSASQIEDIRVIVEF